ncbi:MAG: hypothetical protein FWC43_12835, partial [Planctomycetaceae bacterium]|nr:hypothetical protein [Planctomycetaceae bacterium]
LLFISPNKSRNEAKRNDGKISKNRKLVDGLTGQGRKQIGDEWQPGAQRSEATGPNRGEIRSLRCAPFPATIIIGELVIDLGLG